jgi:hypothetical protein
MVTGASFAVGRVARPALRLSDEFPVRSRRRDRCIRPGLGQGQGAMRLEAKREHDHNHDAHAHRHDLDRIIATMPSHQGCSCQGKPQAR